MYEYLCFFREKDFFLGTVSHEYYMAAFPLNVMMKKYFDHEIKNQSCLQLLSNDISDFGMDAIRIVTV